MAIIYCKVCNGELNLAEELTYASCPYCGSLTTFPEISEEWKESLYNQAEQYRKAKEFDAALQNYEKILQFDTSDAEILWGIVLCHYGIIYEEDPVSHQWNPVCHRTQQESILQNIHYQATLERAGTNERAVYEAEANRIAEIQQTLKMQMEIPHSQEQVSGGVLSPRTTPSTKLRLKENPRYAQQQNYNVQANHNPQQVNYNSPQENNIFSHPPKKPEVSDKKRWVYQLLALFFGCWGIHNFYAGHNRSAIVQLGLTLLLTFLTGSEAGGALSGSIALLEIFFTKKDGNGLPFA